MELKPGYKQTELGIIPEEWTVTRLGLVATIKDGTHQTPRYVPMGVPFYSVEHVTSDDFVNTKFISEEEHRFLTRSFRIERGDILMTRIGSVGECRLVDWDVNASFYVSLALLKINKVVHAPFIVHYSCTRAFKTEIEKRSLPLATPKKINLGPISDILLTLPCAAEQHAIATALTDVDALLDGLDRLIFKKRDLKQAAMQQLLTGRMRLPGFTEEWEERTLSDFGATYGGLTGKTKADFGSGAAQYVTFMNVMANVVIDCGTFERVKVAPTESQNRVLKGDLLFNGSSETPEEVAMCAVMTADVPKLFLNSFCFGFRFRDDDEAPDALFLAYYLRSKEGRELMKSLAQGSTRYNLSKLALLKSPLRVPAPPEQYVIATVLSDMDAELRTLEARRDKTRLLKQAMMQELLTGRTRLVDTQGATA